MTTTRETTTRDSNDYPAVFRRMIERSVTLALQEAARPQWRPEPEKQAQLLFALANALRLPTAWPETLPLLAELAPRMEQVGLREEWLAYLERGINCADLSGDRQTAASLVLERGILLERLGRLPEAQTTLADAIDRFAILADQLGQAKAHNRLAYVLRGRRMADAAAQQVEQAMRLLDQSDAETNYCHMVWGLLAYDRRDWKEAEHHLRRSVQGWRDGKEQRLYAMALINLAAVSMSAANFEGARESLQEAVGILSLIGDMANEALVHLNMGTTYLFLQQPHAAIAESLAAEAVYRSLQDEQRLALIYTNLGLAYTEISAWENAESYFEAAIQRFAALDDYPNLVETLIDRGELYLRWRRTQAARESALRAHELQSLILHESTRRFYDAQIGAILNAVDELDGGENGDD